jgi:hypothetical protein
LRTTFFLPEALFFAGAVPRQYAAMPGLVGRKSPPLLTESVVTATLT